MNKELGEKYRQMAIDSWTNKMNGIYHWSEKQIHTPEYCKEQIEYFKKLKL